MTFKNTADRYGFLAKSFHWIIAFLILSLLPVGLYMGQMDFSPIKLEVYALHKSFGLLVLFLGVARIVWRFVNPPPHSLDTHAPWEKALAHAAHFYLYVCIIGMPLSGWLMSSAGQFPIPFFGVHMPNIMPKNEFWAHQLNTIHEVLGYTLIFILGLHVAGALKHHVIDRDLTLARMTTAGRGRNLITLLLILAAAASFGASGLLIAKDWLAEAKTEDVSQASAPETSTDPASESQWSILKDQSHLTFEATLYNTPFTGEFHEYSGVIMFDPTDLAHSKTIITIKTAAVTTGSAERDGSITGSDWFDSAANPTAVFETTGFEHKEGHDYVAAGTVTIRGQSVPVTLPFTYEETTGAEGLKTAHVTGDVTLDRLAFGMGTGEWENEGTVGHAVKVRVDLTATRPE